MSLLSPVNRLSMAARSLVSRRSLSSSRTFGRHHYDAQLVRGPGEVRAVTAPTPTPDPSAPGRFVWVPLPHAFEGVRTTNCTARVPDIGGYTGMCGQRYGHEVHTEPGDPAQGALGREPGSAVPSDHVDQRQLEDYLRLYGKLDRLDAQRIAHVVTAEYDLFPKGLLLIHRGLDAG